MDAKVEEPEPQTDYRINDIVVCKVRDNNVIVRMEKNYDTKISFKIIGIKISKFEVAEYALYVPEYVLVQVNTRDRVTRKIASEYSVDPKFMDDYILRIRSSQIVTHEFVANGMFCVNCDDYFDKAGPNQEDGTMVCYSCRQNPWR